MRSQSKKFDAMATIFVARRYLYVIIKCTKNYQSLIGINGLVKEITAT